MNETIIIGVGPGGKATLTAEMRRYLAKADIVCGGQRLLDMFPSLKGEKVPIKSNLAQIADLIKKNLGQKRVVVLASGDPGFFGIAGYLTNTLGKDFIKVIPNVSAMQIAFARIGESWEDASFVSVHGRQIEDIVHKIRNSEKIGIFTDGEHTPAAIARVLLNNGFNDYTAYICENLGESTERIIKTSLQDLNRKEFSSLNILILLKNSSHSASISPSLLGIPDEEFYQQRPKDGLITKQEIRAISIAKMRLTEDSIVWDIGAGSGAISVEASFLARRGFIFAIEKNVSGIAVIRENVRKFKADNVRIIKACAPENMDNLPAPSAVFIGGSGGQMDEIIKFVSVKLKPGGHLVINIIGLEHLNTALNSLRENGFTPEITLANIARSTVTHEITRLSALNPVFIITSRQGGEEIA